MGTNKLISDRIGNEEKALEVDRGHSDEDDKQCHKTSPEVEPTVKKEKGKTKDNLLGA